MEGVSRGIAGSEQLYQVTRMIKGIGKDQVVTFGESPMHFVKFFFDSVVAFSLFLFLSSPPSRSHGPVPTRLRVSTENVPMCASNTSFEGASL